MVQFFVLIFMVLSLAGPVYANPNDNNKIMIMVTKKTDYAPISSRQWHCDEKYVALLNKYDVRCTQEEQFTRVILYSADPRFNLNNEHCGELITPDISKKLDQYKQITHFPKRLFFNGKEPKKNNQELLSFTLKIQGQQYSFVVQCFSIDQIPTRITSLRNPLFYLVGFAAALCVLYKILRK